MISAVLALGCWYLFSSMWRKEPRRLRNAVVLLVGVWFAGTTALEVIGYVVPALLPLFGLATLALPFSVVIIAGFLIRNGFQMVRREGRSLGNLLSLLAGVVLLALPVMAVLLVITLNPVAVGAAALAFFLSAQIGLSFLTFLVFTILYARREPRPGADAVVVLGAGLIRGGVGPLLASRLERGRAAREVQQRALTTGPSVPDPSIPMIVSGGQGDDEPRSEASAMAEYLISHGLGESDVLLEDRSRTTEQNLQFSREVATAALPAGSQPGHLLVATNGYHAPRAALLSRHLGIDADVVGAKTADYYVPSGYLREFAGVMVMSKRTQLLLAVPGLLLSVGFTMLLMMSQGY